MNDKSVPGESRAGPAEPFELPYEITDIKSVDWNRVWRAQFALRDFQKRDASFWDGRAASFAKLKDTDYIGQLISIMQPEPHWTVLDMGCGSGALALPLAKLVTSVTAVDFSREMLDEVNKGCAATGVSNIKTIHGGWEDDWRELGIGAYEAAVASRSMFVRDLQASIMKLDAVARKRVYIVTVVGDGPRDRRLFDAIGRPFDPGPDYIYYYNLLYQMGIRANVDFIQERRNKAYRGLEEAVESVRWMFGDLTSQEEDRIYAYFREHLAYHSGFWRLLPAHVVRWAVIWWEKE
ncbi:MAG: class I SAM-dependent methyltransferase [Pseudomonadota bacterium]|nr:class I SAM-dependent methyltransferase [Pseudomonadota bacterium]